MAKTAMKVAFEKAGFDGGDGDAADRLLAIGLEALGKHSHDLDAARAYILAKIGRDGNLLWQLFQRWERPALDLLIGDVARNIREERAKRERDKGSGAKPNGGPRTGPSAAEKQAARGEVVRVLSRLDIERINNRPIGDCTPKEAIAWAGKHHIKVRFVQMLTANLPLTRPIREFIRPEEADAIYRRAEEEQDNA